MARTNCTGQPPPNRSDRKPGPSGLKPDKGETWDYFVNSGKEAFEQAVHNPDNSPEYAKYYGKEWDPEEPDEVEINREMAARLLWKPYMKSHTLAPLLGAVSTETEVIWGAGTPDNPGQHLHAVPQRDQELQGPDDRRLRPHLRRWKNRPSSPSWS